MTQIRKSSYLKPLPERLQVIDWQLIAGDRTQPLPAALADWDPLMSVHVLARIQVDTPGVISDCHLPSDAVIRVGLVWYSSGTGLRGSGEIRDLSGDFQGQIILTAQIDGALLGDRVTLRSCLTLQNCGTQGDKLAPRLPGTSLIEHKVNVLLEGDGARFPLELIHFSEAGWLPAKAGWYFDWNPHMLRQTVLGDVRLYLNADHETVRRAVSEQQTSDGPIRETIFFDMARVMITGALSNTEFVESAEGFPDGSIGATIRRLLKSLFPNQHFRDLQTQYQQEPYRFECILQDKLDLFRENR